MTREDIIRMAREAGLANPLWIENDYAIIERFAQLVAAAEREACAKLVEETDFVDDTYETYARAIRARGQQ